MKWLIELGRRAGPGADRKPKQRGSIGPGWHLKCPRTLVCVPLRLALSCPACRAHRIFVQWHANQAPGRELSRSQSLRPEIACDLHEVELSQALWYHALICIQPARRDCRSAAISVECIAVVRRCNAVASALENSTLAWLFAHSPATFLVFFPVVSAQACCIGAESVRLTLSVAGTCCIRSQRRCSGLVSAICGAFV